MRSFHNLSFPNTISLFLLFVTKLLWNQFLNIFLSTQSFHLIDIVEEWNLIFILFKSLWFIWSNFCCHYIMHLKYHWICWERNWIHKSFWLFLSLDSMQSHLLLEPHSSYSQSQFVGRWIKTICHFPFSFDYFERQHHEEWHLRNSSQFVHIDWFFRLLLSHFRSCQRHLLSFFQIKELFRYWINIVMMFSLIVFILNSFILFFRFIIILFIIFRFSFWDPFNSKRKRNIKEKPINSNK